MRLINVKSLAIENFEGKQWIPPYAILSHRWQAAEAKFESFLCEPQASKAGHEKIRSFCTVLQDEGFLKDARLSSVEYCWVDTVCIDKRSSSELSEAINSMSTWYRDSRYCVVHLNDVSHEDVRAEPDVFRNRYIRNSEWFRRGWTLQETLFPLKLVFCSRYWKRIECLDKSSDTGLALISSITNIPQRPLSHPDYIFDGSVAERMSWAANRKTTRVEDTAYCLLGLFNINMPLLYGEGEKAFFRLQREMIDQYEDESIFAWLDTDPNPTALFHKMLPILAPKPSWFTAKKSSKTEKRRMEMRRPYRVTNRGLEIEACAVQFSGTPLHEHFPNRYMVKTALDESSSAKNSQNGEEVLIIQLNCCTVAENTLKAQPWLICLRRISQSEHGLIYGRVLCSLTGNALWAWLVKFSEQNSGVHVELKPCRTYFIATTEEQITNSLFGALQTGANDDVIDVESLADLFQRSGKPRSSKSS